MKILFSPSESKTDINSEILIRKENFIFKELFDKRLEILKIYDDFIKNANNKELCKLFGLKEISPSLKDSIFKKGCIKAINRYNGVAYNYLNYKSLNKQEQDYIDKNLLIFSNLFGILRANDLIPEYKLKQGEKIGLMNIENFYKQNFSNTIDKFLQNEFVIDLRAGFYEKFYDIKQEFYTFKFIKNKKVVSHYAKAYRGKIVRELAKNCVNNKNDLLNINFNEISLIDIKKIGFKNELLFEIH